MTVKPLAGMIILHLISLYHMLLKPNTITLTLLLLCCAAPARAQRTHSFSLGTGTIYYYGDLTDRFNNSLLRPSGSITYSRYIMPTVSFRVGAAVGEIGATDAMATADPRRVRNLHFRSPLMELSGVLVYEILRDRNFGTWAGKPHFSPLIFGGVNIFRFNPKALYNGEWVPLQPLGTEGQFIPGHQPGPYMRIQAGLPFGGGFSLRLAEYSGLSFEIGYRLTFTDYLDDVSTVYPDFEALAQQENGALAITLSERSLDNRFGPGEIRGNSGANDGYFFAMVSVVYYLNRFATRN